MSSGGMDAKLSEFVKKKYPDSKSDLFAVFMDRCMLLTFLNGFQAMITQHSWMFLASYERLRQKFQSKDILSMAHLGAHAFEEIGGEVVQTTSFIIRNCKIKGYKGAYKRLVDANTQDGKESLFLSNGNLYAIPQERFYDIPGMPIAYWVSEQMSNAFVHGQRFSGETKKGVLTGDNNKFLRFWYEIDLNKASFSIKSHDQMVRSGLKWFPVTSGGRRRKWYGNLDTVVNLENDGLAIKTTAKNYRLRDPQYYFLESVTWTEVSTGMFTCRYVPEGILFGNGGPVCFFFHDSLKYNLGLLNSKVVMSIMAYIAPTINFGPEQISKIPVFHEYEDVVERLVNENITISKDEWDSFEVSWDFKEHPFIALARRAERKGKAITIRQAFENWTCVTEERFYKLKENEEKLNRLFIDIYGLDDELTSEVKERDITVRRADLQRDVRSFISYAVGCMFGRYTLGDPGLIYAGGEWDETKYQQFQPDKDAIIPICDDDYFEDDIVGRFVSFVEKAFGKGMLEDNLRYIADALGGKGSSREVIRKYFINDFYADHLKVYQKRPIYWLFDSGKKNGFKCLIYMHRYQPDTIARIRTDYVHEQQSRYRTAIADLEQRISGAPTFERVKLSKQLDTLQAQAEEIRIYEEKIHHLADQMIRIDLDDGIKHNHSIFKDVLAGI